jgi:C4-dicarboxylate-specific signal transduction histidine kinase
LVRINKTALEMFPPGTTEDDLIGRNALEIIPNLKESGRYKLYMDVIKTGRPLVLDDLVPHPKFGKRHIAVKAFKTDDGLGIVVSDITASKKAVEELRLIREQMSRAEQLAAIGTLGASLAHQMSQPLTVSRLSIEDLLAELQRRCDPRVVKEGLEEALRGIIDSIQIVKEFRQLATGATQEPSVSMDLRAIISRMSHLFESAALAKRVTLEVRGLDKPVSVCSSRKDLEQIVFVLLQNAIDAADGKDERRVIINVSTRDKQVELQFSDDCGGIAPEHLDGIFEPFFTTKPREEATGLGLSIAKDLVSRLGGTIGVESEPGTGSTFRVAIPIRQR